MGEKRGERRGGGREGRRKAWGEGVGDGRMRGEVKGEGKGCQLPLSLCNKHQSPLRERNERDERTSASASTCSEFPARFFSFPRLRSSRFNPPLFLPLAREPTSASSSDEPMRRTPSDDASNSQSWFGRNCSLDGSREWGGGAERVGGVSNCTTEEERGLTAGQARGTKLLNRRSQPSVCCAPWCS